MKKFFLTIVSFYLFTIIVHSQSVGINTTGSNPDSSAMLDVQSTSKGILIPRMTAAQRTAIIKPAIGLLVYQTGSFVDGFYYYNGNAWVQLSASQQVGASNWNITGNLGIDSAAQFIGTVDQAPLIGKVDGEQVFHYSERMPVTLTGYQAGKWNTARYNTFYGYQAGAANTTGDGNIFIGHIAGTANTTGRQNIFIGPYSGITNTAGNYNEFIGFQSGQYNTTGSENIFNGYQAGQSNTTGSQNYFSGMYSGNVNTTGSRNHFEGYQSGASNTYGHDNYFSGYKSGFSNGTAFYNQFTGNYSGYSNTTGTGNYFSGLYSGSLNTTGESNHFEGLFSGYSNTTGNYNFMNGYEAGYANTTGSQNFFVGYLAGSKNTTASYNHFAGYQSGFFNTTGTQNYFSGYKAGYSNTTGNYNHFEGFNAGISNTTGSYNYSSGFNAGAANTIGSSNVYIGANAGAANTTGNGNVFIGYNAGSQETFLSNSFIVNNGVSADPLISGSFSANSPYLNINGHTQITSPGIETLNLVTKDPYGHQIVTYTAKGIGSTWHEEIITGAGGTGAFSILAGQIGFEVESTGDAFLYGNLVEASDARYKKNIASMNGTLDKLKKLRGVTYNWVDAQKNQDQQIGFIAQEVEQVFPQLVKTNTKGFKGVSYANMVPVLVEAIKEQQQQIDELKKLVEQLVKNK